MSNYKRPIKTSKNWVKKNTHQKQNPPKPPCSLVACCTVEKWWDRFWPSKQKHPPSYPKLQAASKASFTWSKLVHEASEETVALELRSFLDSSKGWRLAARKLSGGFGCLVFSYCLGMAGKAETFFFAQKVIIKCKQRESWKLRMGMMRVMEISSKKLRVLTGYTCWNVHCWCFNTQKEVPDSNQNKGHLGNPGV